MPDGLGEVGANKRRHHSGDICRPMRVQSNRQGYDIRRFQQDVGNAVEPAATARSETKSGLGGSGHKNRAAFYQGTSPIYRSIAGKGTGEGRNRQGTTKPL